MPRMHMLPWPVWDNTVPSSDLAAVLEEALEAEREGGGLRLKDALTHLLFYVLIDMARRGRGKRAAKRDDFVVGAGLVASDMAEKALRDMEEFLNLLCDIGEGEEVIYEEIAALGKRTRAEVGDDAALRRF